MNETRGNSVPARTTVDLGAERGGLISLIAAGFVASNGPIANWRSALAENRPPPLSLNKSATTTSPLKYLGMVESRINGFFITPKLRRNMLKYQSVPPKTELNILEFGIPT
jgi:hypothetical protein